MMEGSKPRVPSLLPTQQSPPHPPTAATSLHSSKTGHDPLGLLEGDPCVTTGQMPRGKTRLRQLPREESEGIPIHTHTPIRTHHEKKKDGPVSGGIGSTAQRWRKEAPRTLTDVAGVGEPNFQSGGEGKGRAGSLRPRMESAAPNSVRTQIPALPGAAPGGTRGIRRGGSQNPAPS